MPTLDVHLFGQDEAGKEIGAVFAFWWDGKKLCEALGDKLEPTDPWPAWTGTLPASELRLFAEANPNIYQAKKEAFNNELSALLTKSSHIRVLVQEG